jgi:hypothetical protein
MKKIIVISLFLLAGLATAYTPEQQTMLDGMNLSFRLGVAYDNAIQGQNVAEYNILVDQYNTWIRQHFGEDTNLLMSKMNEPPTVPASSAIISNTPMTKPFNTSSGLSQFGKQQVHALPYSTSKPTQEDFTQQEFERFLTT